MDQLLASRQALTALANRLENGLAASGEDARMTVVRGWEAAVSEEPEAQALRASGAGWDWVALGFAKCSFWDLHVGLLGGKGAEGGWRTSVGLHWRTGVDAVARPLAAEVASLERIHFSPLADEYQQELPLGTSSQDAARAALNLARHVANALAV